MASSVLGEVGRSLRGGEGGQAGHRHKGRDWTGVLALVLVHSPFEWFLFEPEFLAALVQLDGVS